MSIAPSPSAPAVAGVRPRVPGHVRWLAGEADRLWSFGGAARRADGGFARLGLNGEPLDTDPELWITCRMTHVYALAELVGHPGASALVEHGLDAIDTLFRDRENGGWFAQVAPDGTPVDANKAAYPHAFVILSTASAAVAGHTRARALLDEALAVSSAHFWDEDAGMVVEEWDPTFTTLSDYRGINANMHTVEAYLTAYGAGAGQEWLDRAVRIVTRAVHQEARNNNWRLPEHFDSQWNALLEYNADQPADPFRPYGATIGHWFEWGRLALHARAALLEAGREAPQWMLDDALELIGAGNAAWAADGHAGFVYTVDWSGAPVVRERMHWVVCEAIGANAAALAVSGDPVFADAYQQCWDYAAEVLIDPVGGSWWHEVDAEGKYSATVWAEKADLYHAVQATLVPRLPLSPMVAPALARGLLDG